MGVAVLQLGRHRMTATNTVEISREALQELTDYAADDIRNHGGPELESLEEAAREAYTALEQ